MGCVYTPTLSATHITHVYVLQGVFLTLHLWANAVLALVYHPELLSNTSGVETPMSSNMDKSVKLALGCSRTISECLVFADLFASQSYLASPMAVQPIYVAW